MDHPLIRWRLSQGLSQMALAFRCEVSQSVISACERYQKIPQGRALATLLEVTGLPPEALTTPGRFLDEHPDFLGGPPHGSPVVGPPPASFSIRIGAPMAMTVLKYRCRRCQTVFDGQTLTSEAVIPTLRAIVTPEPGEPPSKSEALMAIHSCGTYEFGVADLIGADVEFTAASRAEEASRAEAVSSSEDVSSTEELQRILPSNLPTL